MSSRFKIPFALTTCGNAHVELAWSQSQPTIKLDKVLITTFSVGKSRQRITTSMRII